MDEEGSGQPTLRWTCVTFAMFSRVYVLQPAMSARVLGAWCAINVALMYQLYVCLPSRCIRCTCVICATAAREFRDIVDDMEQEASDLADDTHLLESLTLDAVTFEVRASR